MEDTSVLINFIDRLFTASGKSFCDFDIDYDYSLIKTGLYFNNIEASEKTNCPSLSVCDNLTIDTDSVPYQCKCHVFFNGDQREILLGMNQGMSDYYGAKQWKIQGNPWSGVWQYGVDLRIMVHQLTKIQKFFHQCGWRLVSSADISAKYRKQGNSNR